MFKSFHALRQSHLFTLTSRGMSGSQCLDGTSMLKSKIALCQITSTSVPAENYVVIKNLVEKAGKNDAKMVFFPEACDYISPNKAESLANASELGSPYVTSLCALARDHNIWISLGSIHEKISDTKLFNSHVIIDNLGTMVGVYRKLHLYDVDYPEANIKMLESATAQPGECIVAPVDSPIGKIGMAICYDLRFPEISLALVRMGADILTFPSAFMPATGEAHWEPLLRARAIESQCYVIAAAQQGSHNSQRSSWGHAMIVDPWGSIVATCGEGESITYAEIDLNLVSTVRKKMPLCEQRRNDVYPSLIPHALKVSNDQLTIDTTSYRFGQTSVNASAIFYRTSLTIAFTNLRCVVPGHVLVSPIRCVERMTDLTPDEVSNLFLVVQKVQRVLEHFHQVSSSTICVQDGEHAGQTIKHLHVHILPRRPNDFAENDDIYVHLQKHDQEPVSTTNTTSATNATSKRRTEAEMAQEALALRLHLM